MRSSLGRRRCACVLSESDDYESGGDGDQRQVDEKNPAPTGVFNDDAAGKRAEDRRHAPYAADDALHLGALVGGKDHADDDKRQRVDGAAAETLNRAESDHRFHTLGRAAQRRADEKDRDADQHQTALAVEVGKFAEYRRRQRRGQHVNRKHPAIKIEAAQLGDDGRHRGADNGGIDGKQKNHQHDAEGGKIAFGVVGLLAWRG